jgi:hypothetical protein
MGDWPAGDGLENWAAEQRADQAIAERRAAAWQARVAAEEATFAGVVEAAASTGAIVVVRVAPGRSYRGRIAGTGASVIRIDVAGRAGVYVVGAAVTSLRADPGTGLALGTGRDDRAAGNDHQTVEIAALLSECEAERWDVTISVADDPESVTGTVVAVGMDVVVLRSGVASSAVEVAVRLQSISAVTFTASG